MCGSLMTHLKAIDLAVTVEPRILEITQAWIGWQVVPDLRTLVFFV